MTRTLAPARARGRDDTQPWSGRYREYDLVKEFTIAVVVVAVLTAGLAALFSSPDVHQVTLKSWSLSAPDDFVATAATELDATSATATYGAPYTSTPGAGQKLGPVTLSRLAGVTHPVDTVTDFVVGPLDSIPGDPQLTAALEQWHTATPAREEAWASAYDTALQKTSGGNPAAITAGDYGPVPIMLDRLLRMAQEGSLDGALLLQGDFYQTDYTRPLLFIADGTYLADIAAQQHLAGEQWGMMNETGSFPGQAWLWLYTFWYQVRPFSVSGNGDALVWAVMMVLSLGLICVPFIPGLRSLPRWIPVHRLIWRSYYRQTD